MFSKNFLTLMFDVFYSSLFVIPYEFNDWDSLKREKEKASALRNSKSKIEGKKSVLFP